LWLEERHNLNEILQAGLLNRLNEAATQIATGLSRNNISAP